MSVPVPEQRRRLTNWLEIKGARMHNLKKVDARIPLNAMTVVSGVSGSGKTSLIKGILYPALRRLLGDGSSTAPGAHSAISGDLKLLTAVEMVNQSPIGKSSRSNPVTYVGAYDTIRNMMASQQLSKIRDYKPGHFSFNVDGGRCDTCKGEGEQTVEMQFLADVKLVCEECNGARFKREILDVQYDGKNVSEILDLSVDEAVDFFADHADISRKLQALQDGFVDVVDRPIGAHPEDHIPRALQAVHRQAIEVGRFPRRAIRPGTDDPHGSYQMGDVKLITLRDGTKLELAGTIRPVDAYP